MRFPSTGEREPGTTKLSAIEKTFLYSKKTDIILDTKDIRYHLLHQKQMSGTEFIFSPTYDMYRVEDVFLVAKMGYTDQYIRLQGKNIVLWPKGSNNFKETKIGVQDFILNEISLEDVESQYLDLLFVYGVEYDLPGLTDRIYEVHDIGRIYKLVSMLGKSDYFRDRITKSTHSLFRDNQRKFIDYISEDENRFLDIVSICLSCFYREYDMFENGTIVIPETVFSRDETYFASDTFKNVLTLYLSQTLGIPVDDLNKHNCCQETNRIATLYQDKFESKWFICWVNLIQYGLDVDTWYTMDTHLLSVSGPDYFTTVLMWIKESPSYNHYVCVKKFVDDGRRCNPLSFCDQKIKDLREMFIHLNVSEHMDEIIDTAYDAMFYTNPVNSVMLSSKHMWRIYYVVEFYFRKCRPDWCEQELIRQRCVYIEPGLTDEPDTINVTIDLSEQNCFIDIFNKSPESVQLLLSLDCLRIKLTINNSIIVLNNGETLDGSTIKAINSALQGDMLQSVKNILLIVAILYREVELIRTLLIHGADPTESQHCAIKLALETTSKIAELVLNHSLETYNLSPEICEKLLLKNSLEEPLAVKIDLLLRYGVSWKTILKKYILEVFNNGVLHPVLHDYYISSGIMLSSFLLDKCLNFLKYYEDPSLYKQVYVQIVKWDLRFSPDTTINDLITLKHLKSIQQRFLYEYYNILLSEGLDPRHSDDYIWRKACQKSSQFWIVVCLNGDEYADSSYVKRSETLGENDNWAIKTYLQIGRGDLPAYLDTLYVFLERNIDTLDLDTMTEISRMVFNRMSSEKLSYIIRLRNLRYIERIYDIMDRYKEANPAFSFERHTSILIE